MTTNDDYYDQRVQMVEEQLSARGIEDWRVLEAMRAVPRHEFVSGHLSHLAYRDCPLPIGEQQSISQPFIVALMTQLVRLGGYERVLEIGTGSGYHTAVLSVASGMVFSLERSMRLAQRAGQVLDRLGYDNVEIHVGDGSWGLPDMAPFDAIVVTAAAPSIPGPICAQLSPLGGRMVIPIGSRENQYINLVMRDGDSLHVDTILPVRFVPLVGRFGFNYTPDDPFAGLM